MKKYILLILFTCLLGATSIEAQEVWKKISNKKTFIDLELDGQKVKPTKFELYEIDLKSLDIRLIKTKYRESNNANKVIIKLPTPLGIQQFTVQEAPVFSDELAAKHPNIKSYVGIGIDDPTAIARFSKSAVGFHAMISSGNYPMYLIDPYTKDKKVSIAYHKRNAAKSNFKCLVTENKKSYKYKSVSISDGKLRIYRLALITTGEYSQFHLNRQEVSDSATETIKKNAVLSAINVSMTRVNGIFERDLGITMRIIDNNTNLIFLDADKDNLTDDDSEILLDESQILCDKIIGSKNYDIGHVFTRGDGDSDGLAGYEVVCRNGEKAKGVTGLGTPINDPFDIDLVAHEMGHQFGANHTQSNKGCQRNNSTAVEPGSGSTIMGYAGFCKPNVQDNSDAFFHAVSIAEIQTFINNSAMCAVKTNTNNTIPIANAGNDFVVPKSTPFILKGSARYSGSENSLTYSWEQIDNQAAEMPPLSTNIAGPTFRSLPPKTSSKRYMPSLSTVLAGKISSKWEVVPSVARTLKFSLTVRDNMANSGATARDNMKITVDGNSGPFAVTSQTDTITLKGNSIQTITWDVANTVSSPVNCKNVNILLSTDGGLTYTITIVENTPNDGKQQIIIPNITATQSRIMVEANDNVFYAINSSIFSIDSTASIKKDFSFLNFNLHPNPSKGKITINFNLISTQKITIKLFDIRGRLINTQHYSNAENHFSKEIYYKVASGLYILQIENGTKKIIRKVIID